MNVLLSLIFLLNIIVLGYLFENTYEYSVKHTKNIIVTIKGDEYGTKN